MEKYIALAKKLKALAESGVGGEKYNAEKKLKSLMDKHGITIDDIELSSVDYHWYKVLKEKRQLFFQVVSTVLDSGFPIYRNSDKRGYLGLKINAEDAMEIAAKFEFIELNFEREYDIFKAAFIHSYRLYPKESTKPIGTLLESELERLRKVAEMAEHITPVPFLKRIG